MTEAVAGSSRTPDVAIISTSPSTSAAPSAPVHAPRPSTASPALAFTLTWKYRTACLGGTCLVVTCFSWVSLTQLSKRIYTADFIAPFFVIYFCTSWLLIHFPIYFVAVRMQGDRNFPYKETFWRCLELPISQEKTHPGSIIWRCAVFTLLWNLSAYLFMRALQILAPTHLVTVFVTSQGFVYLLSWIILHERFIAIRTIGVILSFTGMSLITYRDGLSGKLLWGCLLALFSGVAAAAYKVLFCRLLGNIFCGQIAMYHSLLGACNSVAMWPLFLLLYFTQAEPMDWATVPWLWICSAGSSMIVFSSCLIYGEQVTHPVIVNFGFILAIPFSIGADLLFNNMQLDGVTLAAAIVVSLSFILLRIPKNSKEYCLNKLKTHRERSRRPLNETNRSRLRMDT